MEQNMSKQTYKYLTKSKKKIHYTLILHINPSSADKILNSEKNFCYVLNQNISIVWWQNSKTEGSTPPHHATKFRTESLKISLSFHDWHQQRLATRFRTKNLKISITFRHLRHHAVKVRTKSAEISITFLRGIKEKHSKIKGKDILTIF